MKFSFSKDMYPKIALLKAAYSFTDRAYLHLDSNEHEYIVEIKMKPDNTVFALEEFENEILFQTLKYSIYQQTKDLRQLIAARALASTVLEDDITTFDNSAYEKVDIDNVLKDWFEKNEQQ